MPRVLIKTIFNNIKFECQKCGSCCHHRRPRDFDDLVPMDRLKEFWQKSNLIYLTDKDIHDICRRSRRKPDEFVDTLYEYDGNNIRVEDTGKRVILDLPVMKSRKDTTCVFYNEGCAVYMVRPAACRLFPFRVEEETAANGDMVLNIDYNCSCPGIGKGSSVDKTKLEKLVVDQFLQRAEAVVPAIERLAKDGKIQKGAQIYRTLPGRKQDSCASEEQ